MASASPIDFAPLMAPVAGRLLGEPNKRMSRGNRLRFGAHGSMEIDTEEGWFDDHEAKARGGVLELIQHKRGCDKHAALTWLEDEGLKDRAAAPARSLPTFYDYADADGAVAYRVERRGKGCVPPFLQHGPDGRGGFHAARGCMQGVSRLPYRLPELLAADPALPVFVVEGEKDADRLAAAGLVATTNSGGAGKFGAELVPYFAGRRVVILPDNDEPGRAHARDVADKLTGTAGAVAIVELPDLPAKGDVSDWLSATGAFKKSAFDLVRLFAEPALAKAEAGDVPETFPIADLNAWAFTEPSPKAFVMAGYIPREEVTLLTGPGGTNKSTFGLQLCMCAAAEKPLLGVDVAPGAALYVTAEDDDGQNHWRARKIASAIGTTLDRVAGRLAIVSLRGRLNNELATFDSEGRLLVQPAFRLLRSTLEATGAKLLVLDNVAHLFAGNENDRTNVTAFLNLLYSLCRELGVTVVLIGHPNKTGDSYSGSTAWLNAVRSQLVLGRPQDSTDADVRVLTIGKANYARQDATIAFRWHDFALVRDEDLPPNIGAQLAGTILASAENARFLECLAIASRDRQAVSHNKGTNYAPTIFARMPEARGTSAVAFERAMERLRHLQQIRYDQPLWQGVNRHWKQGIKLTSECADPPAPTPCANPHAPPGQVIDIACADLRAPTPLYTTYKGAAPQGSAAPDTDTIIAPAPVFAEDGSWQRSSAVPADPDQPRRHGGPILAPGESDDDPVPGWDDG